jgi:hypothetical protein
VRLRGLEKGDIARHASSTTRPHFNFLPTSIPPHHQTCSHRLIEGVCASSPPSEEKRESDRLEDAAQGTNGDSIEGTFLGEDLGDELRDVT